MGNEDCAYTWKHISRISFSKAPLERSTLLQFILSVSEHSSHHFPKNFSHFRIYQNSYLFTPSPPSDLQMIWLHSSTITKLLLAPILWSYLLRVGVETIQGCVAQGLKPDACSSVSTHSPLIQPNYLNVALKSLTTSLTLLLYMYNSFPQPCQLLCTSLEKDTDRIHWADTRELIHDDKGSKRMMDN